MQKSILNVAGMALILIIWTDPVTACASLNAWSCGANPTRAIGGAKATVSCVPEACFHIASSASGFQPAASMQLKKLLRPYKHRRNRDMWGFKVMYAGRTQTTSAAG